MVSSICTTVQHKFIPRIQHKTTYAWEQIKQHFFGETEETLYLRKVLHGTHWNEERIASLITTCNPYGIAGQLLRQVLKGRNLKTLAEKTFEQAFEKGSIHYERILKFTKDFQFTGEIDIEELAMCLPEPIPQPKKTLMREIHKTFRVVIHFFPNFLDTTLKAFSLREVGKGPETIWDFAAMLEIYFKMFMIPHGIVILASTLTAQLLSILLLSVALFGGLVTALCLYIKYRPCPNRLPHSVNLTELAKRGKLDPVVGRDNEIAEISSYLGKKEDGISTNIILIGEPGVGKTELVKGVAQAYQEKKIFAINTPMLSSGYSNVAEKLNSILMDIKGRENEVILFLDELGDAKEEIRSYIKPLLGRGGVQVIAATTKKDYEEKILKDDALVSRFHTIEVEQTTREQTLQILRERINNKGGTILFEDRIAEKILDTTRDKQQPRHAVNLLDRKINQVSSFNVESYVPKELIGARDTLFIRQRQYKLAPNPQLKEDILTLLAIIEKHETNRKRMINLALRVRSLIKTYRMLDQKRLKLAKARQDTPSLRLLHNHLLPWMKSQINEQIKHIPPEIPLVVKVAES